MRLPGPCLWLFALVPLCAPGPAAAQPAVSLPEVLGRALEGNLDLTRQGLDLAIAAARLEAARGQFDVVLGADGQAKQIRTPARPDLPIDFVAGTETDLSGDLKLARQLETGGQVALTLAFTRVHSDFPLTSGTLNIPGFPSSGAATASFWQVPLTLSVNQALWRNRGTALATIQVRRAALARDVELLRRARTATDVVQAVVGAYWDLAYQGRDLDIRRGALRLAEDQLQQTRDLIAVGRAAPLDLASVEAAIADRTEQVLLGEQLLVDASLRVRRLMGERVAPDAGPLTAAAPPAPTPRALDPRALLERALAQNPAVLVLRQATRLTELDLEAAENNLRPQLDFIGSFGSLGRKTGGWSSFKEAFRFEAINWSAGLAFSLPVQNRGARGGAEAARLTLKRGRVDVADLEAATAEGVVRLTTAVRVAARRMEVGRDGVGAARRSLEAERARFDTGRATNHDLLRRQEELEVALLREARAAIDLLKAESALDALVGELLERHGLGLRR
ncbi:MAG TPA: TolC family protein [Polyangia bacterium]|jgi:outer membrane protein TolC